MERHQEAKPPPPPLETSVAWIEERMEAVESSLKGIDTTLTNHMTEYKAAFTVLGGRIGALTWVVGMQAAVTVMIIGALLSVAVLSVFKLAGGP